MSRTLHPPHPLRIGQVARLLGVTSKTIRHWEKVGLAVATERSPNGYRRYTPADLLRLQRVQRLQLLGLSLRQITVLLGVQESQRPWRTVLQALHADLTAQVAALSARQQRVAALLAADSLDALGRAGDLPHTLLAARERFPDHTARLSADLLEQDARVFAALDGFHWPDDTPGEQAIALLERLTTQPALYHRLLALAERLAALAHVAPDDPCGDQLIADWTAALAADPALADLCAHAPLDDATVAGVLHEAIMATLSPAQRRVIAALTGQADPPADPDGPGVAQRRRVVSGGKHCVTPTGGPGVAQRRLSKEGGS